MKTSRHYVAPPKPDPNRRSSRRPGKTAADSVLAEWVRNDDAVLGTLARIMLNPKSTDAAKIAACRARNDTIALSAVPAVDRLEIAFMMGVKRLVEQKGQEVEYAISLCSGSIQQLEPKRRETILSQTRMMMSLLFSRNSES